MAMPLTPQTRGTTALIATSVVLFVVDMFTNHAILLWGAISPGLWTGEWHRLIAPNFIHSGFPHLFFNMYALWIFGRLVEGLVGMSRFLAIFFISGLAGFSVSLLSNPATLAVGASAAIFGLMGYTLHFRIRRLPMRRLPMDMAFLQILGLNLILGFVVPNIDHYAHLGGFVGGILAGGLVGLPYLRGPITGPADDRVVLTALERVVSGALLGFLVFAAVMPLSFGAVVGSPGLQRAMENRYGSYFIPYRAVDTSILWIVSGSSNQEWAPVEGRVNRTVDRPIAIGAFWRWAKGADSATQASYEVRWSRLLERDWVTVHVDHGTVNRVDGREGFIFRRGVIAETRSGEFDGDWQVVVLVNGKEQFKQTFTVATRRGSAI